MHDQEDRRIRKIAQIVAETATGGAHCIENHQYSVDIVLKAASIARRPIAGHGQLHAGV